jgi:hypothetical protein
MSAIPDDIMKIAEKIAADTLVIPRNRSGLVNFIANVIMADRQRTDDFIKEVKAVMEPFGNLASAVFHVDEDGREMNFTKPDDRHLWGFDNAMISYGDLRAVRALLSRLEER